MHLNSALTANYLRRYHFYQADAWEGFNITLPASVSRYGSLPFLVVIGSNIIALNVSGATAGTTIGTTGITTNTLVSPESGKIEKIECVYQNNKTRIKFTLASASSHHVDVYCLRSGIEIESGYFN